MVTVGLVGPVAHGDLRGVRRTATFAWRVARNVAAATPLKPVAFPVSRLASRFGPADAEYGWSVFAAHRRRLTACGFTVSSRVLEIGPGRNLGTALLWWATAVARGVDDAEVWLWDRYPCIEFEESRLCEAARRVVETRPPEPDVVDPDVLETMGQAADGRRRPSVKYVVGSPAELRRRAREPFGLVYSHAALEHVWRMHDLWSTMAALTSPGGFQCHLIDLADHGRRHSNHLEMCQWSPWAYWLSMRFVPGAVNRWRANDHLQAMREVGLSTRHDERDLAASIPVARRRLAQRFRDLDDRELLTTALWVVAVREGAPSC